MDLLSCINSNRYFFVSASLSRPILILKTEEYYYEEMALVLVAHTVLYYMYSLEAFQYIMSHPRKCVLGAVQLHYLTP